MRTALALCGTLAMLGLVACASSPSYEYRSDRYGFSGFNETRELRRDAALAERDELITSRIRAQFARDPQVDARDIDVDTYRGTVELSGYVDDRDEIRRAVKIALATPGVRTVRNEMRVARD